jgi:hypothetical protein
MHVAEYRGTSRTWTYPAQAQEAALAFNDATVLVQPGAGHFPWIDDATASATAVGAFLG